MDKEMRGCIEAPTRKCKPLRNTWETEYLGKVKKHKAINATSNQKPYCHNHYHRAYLRLSQDHNQNNQCNNEGSSSPKAC